MKIKNKPKKSLGQNFLIDKNIINKIIKIGNINHNKSIMEIGPGYGSLTKAILSMNPKNITAIEKDKKLSLMLIEKFKNIHNIEIINEDILATIKKKDIKDNLLVFGNLPYNISTQILANLITQKRWPPWYNFLVFMFQKEVADRIIAKPNTKEYGRLSVLSNWRLDVKKHFDISKNSFFPKPKINSTLLSFKPKNNFIKFKDPKNLEKVTNILFSNRRKMINKNLKRTFNKKLYLLEKLNIDLNKRPGELTNETFYRITIEYEKLLN